MRGQVQTVEPVPTAQIDIRALALQQLHHRQFLPEDCVVDGREPALVPLVDPLLLELVVEELGRSDRVLLVEGEDVLRGIEVAVIGRDVEQ